MAKSIAGGFVVAAQRVYVEDVFPGRPRMGRDSEETQEEDFLFIHYGMTTRLKFPVGTL